jgi:hypothetical protein
VGGHTELCRDVERVHVEHVEQERVGDGEHVQELTEGRVGEP